MSLQCATDGLSSNATASRRSARSLDARYMRTRVRPMSPAGASLSRNGPAPPPLCTVPLLPRSRLSFATRPLSCTSCVTRARARRASLLAHIDPVGAGSSERAVRGGAVSKNSADPRGGAVSGVKRTRHADASCSLIAPTERFRRLEHAWSLDSHAAPSHLVRARCVLRCPLLACQSSRQ